MEQRNLLMAPDNELAEFIMSLPDGRYIELLRNINIPHQIVLNIDDEFILGINNAGITLYIEHLGIYYDIVGEEIIKRGVDFIRNEIKDPTVKESILFLLGDNSGLWKLSLDNNRVVVRSSNSPEINMQFTIEEDHIRLDFKGYNLILPKIDKYMSVRDFVNSYYESIGSTQGIQDLIAFIKMNQHELRKVFTAFNCQALGIPVWFSIMVENPDDFINALPQISLN